MTTAIMGDSVVDVDGLPWLTGDATGIAELLRVARTTDRPDGASTQAVRLIADICERPGLSSARRTRLTAAVVEAARLVREEPAPAGETPAESGDRVEIGADGCGCPITEEQRANGSSIEGTERVDHRPKCWALLAKPVDENGGYRGDDPDGAQAITARLQRAEAAGPDGSCVEAIVLIEAIHSRDAPPAEKVRLTGVVLAAVREVRGWTP